MIYRADGKPAPRTPYRFNIFDWLAVLSVALLIFFAWFNPALGAEVTHQISQGQPFSSVYLPSLPVATSSHVVYVQDAATDGAFDLWSAPIDGGAPVRLSNALVAGQSVKFAVTPDGARVVYVTDQTTRGIPDLYSVPINGGASVKLSMDLTALPGQVRDFLISPTSQRVYYAADGASNNVIELWRVDLAGGPSTRLNASISGNYDVFEYHASPSDQVTYRVGRSTVGGHELFTVPGNGRGSQAHKISRSMVAGGGVQSDWKISGERAVYRCDCEFNGRFDLYSVATTGGASTRISGGVVSVESFSLTDDDASGQGATYSQRTAGVTSWWSVPITGGTPVPVPPPMPEPVRSPDGQWIVYGAGVGLWSSGDDGGHQLVSCAGQSVTATFLAKPAYSVSPDSKRVVYVAGNEVWTSPISGSVCPLFADGFESGGVTRWN